MLVVISEGNFGRIGIEILERIFETILRDLTVEILKRFLIESSDEFL